MWLVHAFLGLVVLCFEDYFSKNGVVVHLKWDIYFYLVLDFLSGISPLLISGICCFPLLLVSYPTIEMSCAIPKTFDRSLTISLIFYWNMSPAGTTPNGSLVDP